MMRTIIAILILCVVGTFGQCIVNTTEPYRLPSTIVPHSYIINLHLENTTGSSSHFVFPLNGNVQVQLDVVRTTSCIVLHAAGLTLSNITFVQNGQQLTPTDIHYEYEFEMAVLTFPRSLVVGSGSLSYSYTGFVNIYNATGFFVSPLEVLPPSVNRSDIERYLAENISWQDDPIMFATQFEGPYARMAFPCFDEPGLKALFTVSITIPSNSNMFALSNTPLDETESGSNGLTTYHFSQTPVPITTYLVAFAVGNFDYIEATSNGINYRIYTAPGKSSFGTFALNITVQLMDYWQDLWNFKFPFPKLDQISVPRIFQDGMENIGLITYWPGFLLSVPELWTVENYQQNCMVISHELSHLWFGDTVTLPWWSETYNNEGFARYFQYTGCSAIFPQWNDYENGAFSFFTFVYTIIKPDSLGTLRPEIQAPDQVSGSRASVSNAFAGPTYPKGAALNRMFNIYMGDSNWNGALAYHLNKWAFTNPTTGDLLDSFDSYTNNQYGYKEKFMPWLTLAGFPVVTLDYNPSSNTVTASQLPVSRYIPQLPENSVWFVTVSVSVNGDLDSLQYVNFTQLSTSPIQLTGSSGQFIIGNANHTSYLVTNYPDSQWPPILNQLASPSYDAVLRNLLVQDVFILAQMSHQTVQLPLNMTSAFKNLQLSSYWTYMLPLLLEVTVPLDTQPYYSTIQQSLVDSLQPVVSYVSSAANVDATFKSLVLFYDVLFGDQAKINSYLSLFSSNPNSISSDLQQAVYWSVGRYGSSSQYNQLFNLFVPGSASSNNVLLGLSGPQNLVECNRTLTLFDDSFNLANRLIQVKNMLTYNPYCRHLAWDYIRVTGYQLFVAEGSAAASQVLNSFNGILSGAEYYQEVSEFLDYAVTKSWVTEDQRHNALVSININTDIIYTNQNFQ